MTYHDACDMWDVEYNICSWTAGRCQSKKSSVNSSSGICEIFGSKEDVMVVD